MGRPRRGAAEGPVDPAARRSFLRGLAFERASQHALAERAYKTAIDLDDRYDKWTYRLALMMFRTGKVAEAQALLVEQLGVYPGDARCSRLLGMISVIDNAGMSAELAQCNEDGLVRQALQLAEQDEDAFDACSPLWFAVANDLLGEQDEALKRYTQFVESQEHHDLAVFGRMRVAELSVDTEQDRAAGSAAQADEPSWLASVRSGRDASRDWSVAACVLESVVSADPQNATAFFQLGIAHRHLDNLDQADDAFKRAAALRPLDPSVLQRRAAVLVLQRRYDAAIESLKAAIVLRPTFSLYQRLADVYEQNAQWDEARAAREMATRIHPSPDNAASRRLALMYRRRSDWAATASMYASLCAAKGKAADWYQLGFAREKLGDFQGAAQAYQQAVGKQPRADWLIRLGMVTEKLGEPVVRAHSTLGLILDPDANTSDAASYYRRATELDPLDVMAWSRLGMVEMQSGSIDEAIQAFKNATELDPSDWRGFHRLGRALSERANRRGAYTASEHDAFHRVWGRAIELAPRQDPPRQQLSRMSIKARRWQQASFAAWHVDFPRPSDSAAAVLVQYLERVGGAPDVQAVARAINEQGDAVIQRVPTDWLFALHWRLLDDGLFTLGYAAKRLLARSLITSQEHRRFSTQRLLETAQAHVYLGEIATAEHLLTGWHVDIANELDRKSLDKYLADLALLQGDIGPYATQDSLTAFANSPASEDRFAKLITGRSIAIVGPGMSPLDNGEEIDSFDTVIRTKFIANDSEDLAHMIGRRTDLSYYTLSGTHFLGDDIVHALGRGDLKMAVFRSAAYDRNTPFLSKDGDLRYAPLEYSLGFRSAQFAMQRIAYDVLRYLPSKVKMFNIDFFTGQDNYVPGYVQDYSSREDGVIRTMSGFGHDYLADFEFTQSLVKNGLVETDTAIGQLLELTSAEYLNVLDRRATSS